MFVVAGMGLSIFGKWRLGNGFKDGYVWLLVSDVCWILQAILTGFDILSSAIAVCWVAAINAPPFVILIKNDKKKKLENSKNKNKTNDNKDLTNKNQE